MPDESSRVHFSWKHFFLWSITNGIGIVVLEGLQFLVGMMAFTDDVAVPLKALETIYWIWSPLPLLLGFDGASHGTIPSIQFVTLSATTMGVLPAIVFPRLSQHDTSAEPTRAEQDESLKP